MKFHVQCPVSGGQGIRDNNNKTAGFGSGSVSVQTGNIKIIKERGVFQLQQCSVVIMTAEVKEVFKRIQVVIVKKPLLWRVKLLF